MGDETASMFLASTATEEKVRMTMRVIGSDTNHVSRTNSYYSID